MHPQGVLESAVKQAELPTIPSDIKINEAEFAEAVSISAMLRNRFGFLDLS